MNEYREVVPKSQFESLKRETARLKSEIPRLKTQIEQTKVQTRNIENEVNFMMAGVENTEEIKTDNNKHVSSLEGDIENLKSKIEEAIESYSKEKIELQNMDLTFKRIMSKLLAQSQMKENEIVDPNLLELIQELTINEKQIKKERALNGVP